MIGIYIRIKIEGKIEGKRTFGGLGQVSALAVELWDNCVAPVLSDGIRDHGRADRPPLIRRERKELEYGINSTDCIASPRIERLRDFVVAFSELVENAAGEADILYKGSRLLKELIGVDDWLPARYAESSPTGYRQYLLHADSRERFSVVSFVWGPGQKSPIHDHTVWGIVGILRGAELEQSYSRGSNGGFVEKGAPVRLGKGEVTAVSPEIGDFHRVANAPGDQPSVSIHVYGANIGAVRRSVYEMDGTSKTFVSGYSNTELPNLWDRSKTGEG